MFKSLKIFRIFDIDVKLHTSWWFVFVLLAWSLSTSFFPVFFPDNTTRMYWTLGITSTLLLFVSVLLHELAHSLVAKAKKIQVDSITLFFFGGVSGITREDLKPSSEFFMAIAGPLFSFLLAGLFYYLYMIKVGFFLTALSYYLFQLNLILGAFNLLPGFPLDGGRAFRALLHGWLKDLRKATKIATNFGKVVAGFLLFFGLLALLQGFANGLWFIFLGGFLYFIAKMSYEQVVIKDVLDGIKVKELMEKKVGRVKPSLTFSQFVKKYVSKDKEVFLVGGKDFLGILDLKNIKAMSPELQEKLTVKQLALPVHDVKALRPDDSAYTAFRKFSSQNIELLPVTKNGKVLGVLTKQVLLTRFLWETKFRGKVKKK